MMKQMMILFVSLALAFACHVRGVHKNIPIFLHWGTTFRVEGICIKACPSVALLLSIFSTGTFQGICVASLLK